MLVISGVIVRFRILFRCLFCNTFDFVGRLLEFVDRKPFSNMAPFSELTRQAVAKFVDL